MIARLVLRNSTDKQAKAGTIAAQRAPVRELAKRCGADKLIEYVEEGISGAAPLDERDVMRRLLDEAKPGDLVCAFDLSRLTRAESMLQRYKVLGHLADAGVKIATVGGGEFDLSTMGGRMMLHVDGEHSAEERKKIRARTMAGKAEAARSGRKPQGVTPFGLRYSKETRQWSIVEEPAAIVREIFDRLVRGETTGKIAADFEARKVPFTAPGGKPRANAGKWTPRRVWHLATQQTYMGMWRFDGQDITVPAIVDVESWQRVQKVLRCNRARGQRRTQHVYVLDAEHGRCALCGSDLRIQWGGQWGDVPYYVCAKRLNERDCELPWWRTDEADPAVWGEVKRVLERPDLVEQALRERTADTSDESKLAARDVEKGEARLQHLADVRGTLIRQMQKGNLTEAELDKELSRIAREVRLVQQTVTAAREAADKAAQVVAEIGSVRAWLKVVRAEALKADAAERRRICRALAPSVQLDTDAIKIGLRLRDPASLPLANRPVGSTCCSTENHCETEPPEIVADLTVTVTRRSR